MKKYIKYSVILIFVLILSAPFLFIVGRQMAINEKYNYNAADHLDYSWIPPGASNVYCRGTGVYRIYNFNIDEDGFRDWAKDIGVALVPCDRSKGIKNYKYIDEVYGKNIDEDKFDDVIRRVSHSTDSGIFGEQRRNNGGGYTLLFDRIAGIGYVEWSAY